MLQLTCAVAITCCRRRQAYKLPACLHLLPWAYEQHLRLCAYALVKGAVSGKDSLRVGWCRAPAEPLRLMQSKTHIGSSRRMKNPEKLAASKKKPLVARYILKNRVILTRDPTLVPEYAT